MAEAKLSWATEEGRVLSTDRVPRPARSNCMLQQGQQQDHQQRFIAALMCPGQEHFTDAMYRAGLDKFSKNLSLEAEESAGIKDPSWGTLEQQQRQLEILQRTISFCDERYSIGKSCRAREAAVRARFLQQQLQHQQQQQHYRQQRNSKLIQEAVSLSLQKDLRAPPLKELRLSLCLASLHKQMQETLTPNAFAAAAKVLKLGGIGGFPPASNAAGWPHLKEDVYRHAEPYNAVSRLTGSVRDSEPASALYDNEVDFAAAIDLIQTKASSLLHHRDSAATDKMHGLLFLEGVARAHMPLRHGDVCKLAEQQMDRGQECGSCCGSHSIPDEISGASGRTELPASRPQRFIAHSARACCNRFKLALRQSQITRKSTAASKALISLSSAAQVTPMQPHQRPMRKLRNTQRTSSPDSIRKSSAGFVSPGNAGSHATCAPPTQKLSGVLDSLAAVSGGECTAPSYGAKKRASTTDELVPTMGHGVLTQAATGANTHGTQPQRGSQLSQLAQRHTDQLRRHKQGSFQLIKREELLKASQGKPLLQDRVADRGESGRSSRSRGSATDDSVPRAIHHVRNRATTPNVPAAQQPEVGIGQQQPTSPPSTKAMTTAKKTALEFPLAKALPARARGRQYNSTLGNRQLRCPSPPCPPAVQLGGAGTLSTVNRQESLGNRTAANWLIRDPGQLPHQKVNVSFVPKDVNLDNHKVQLSKGPQLNYSLKGKWSSSEELAKLLMGYS
ncbi:hypothetical protein Efla_000155 [Eimeria flavescens]